LPTSVVDTILLAIFTMVAIYEVVVAIVAMVFSFIVEEVIHTR
jgi:hypothetical protein